MITATDGTIAKRVDNAPTVVFTAPMDKHPFSNLTPEQRAEVDQAVKNFSGMSDNLSSALGALAMGHYVGWRGLLFVHTRPTIKRYEEILGMDFKEVLPERTDQTERLLGIRLADQLNKFWALVKGEIPIPQGKSYIDAEGQEDLFAGGASGRTT